MEIKSRVSAFLLAIIVFLSACSKSEKPTTSIGAEEKLNISYGPDTKNTLDLYLPENRTGNTKIIVMLHGGFWLSGDKEELTQYAKYLQQKGFAVANLNYRLTNTPENNVHPAQINDIQKAIDFISLNSAKWNISSDKFGLVGASAGGHLALLYSYAYNDNNRVKAVVSIAGPTNLTDTRNVSNTELQVISLLIGSRLDQNPTAFAAASPINHVNASSKPTFLIHGKSDKIVPYQQAEDLKAKLDHFKVDNELLLFDNLGHEDVINQQNANAVLTQIQEWLESKIR